MNDMNAVKLNRESTKITISEFYERNQLKKYNFEPEYQRRGDVWSEEKQSFLIDSILKNYPMPPIFLHQVIDSDGATRYNVIDGKQRLGAILKFIKNEIPLPSDYDVGAFGDSRLNGRFFNELNGELQPFKMQFWKYVISIEYIETDDSDIINNVFDRLNRNGEPLEPQELRKAKYSDTTLLKMVERLTSTIDWSKLDKVKINRMQDAEFVSELVFFILEGGPNNASKREDIDECYKKWAKELDERQAKEIETEFTQTINYLQKLDIDFEAYKINGVSHFYALFAIADYCSKKDVLPAKISKKINDFYCELREGNVENSDIQNYRESMQSNTRSKGQRGRRIEALLHYCGFEHRTMHI